MVEEIFPDLYRIEVPLPKNPLRSINCYVIKTKGRSLIIDTGMNREECSSVLFAGLKELDIDAENADFFVTHCHVDHMGLVSTIASDKSTVYFNQREAAMMANMFRQERWSGVLAFFIANGFPQEDLDKTMLVHPAHLYGPKRSIPFTTLKDGDKVEAGDYRFACIDTPGHSPGHMCLYDKEKKILVSGDHILFDITPNISYWPEQADSLRDYLNSLDKVFPLDVKLVLPGHRARQGNHRERISEIKQHHQVRLKEVTAALQNGGKTAYEVAPQITWQIKYHNWAQFPAAQKYFAFGETIAHLEYLAADNAVKKYRLDGRILYSLP